MSNKVQVPKLRFKGFEDEWESKRINEIAEINPKTVVPDNFNYVDLDSIKGTSLQKFRFESKKNAPSRAQRVASKGDVFFQTVRPYQKNNYYFNLDSKIDFVFSTGYAQLRPSIDSYYLLTLLQRKQFVDRVLVNCTGTSYPAINSKDLSNIKTYVSSVKKEQQKIGDFFAKLDRLIELHSKKLGSLRIYKKGLLKYLYQKNIDEAPYYRFSGYQDKIGTQKLKDVGYTFTGISGKSKEDFGHGKAKYVTYLNVFENTLSKSDQVDSVEIDSKQNEIEYGDILFTTSSETAKEVGMSSIWLYDIPNTYLNSFCFGYRLEDKFKKSFDYYYLAYLLRSPLIRNKMVVLAQGISRFNISKTKVMNLQVPVPSIKEQYKVGKYFYSLDKKIECQIQYITHLKQLKKAYLQKMFC